MPNRLLAASVLLLPLAAPAFGQSELPRDLIEASRLTDAQSRTVASFVEDNRAGLVDGDASDLRRHRTAVLAPLTEDGVSVDFRIRLGAELAPVLEAMLASGQPDRQLTALRIAGSLATAESVALLTEAMSDEAPDHRLMAAAALRRTFRAINDQRPAMTEGRVRQIVDLLAGAMPSETSADVADAMGRALIEASSGSRDGFDGVRELAFDTLIAAASTRLQSAEPTHAREMILASRALEHARQQITLGEGLSSARVLASAGLAGDAAAYAAKTAQAGGMSSIDRSSAVALTAAAEAVIFFAQGQLDDAGTPTPTQLSGILEDGGRDGDFVAGVRDRLTGASGVLTSPPFRFDAARFDG
ncbi:MAG: HEAT repeat domain-containing protein [Planctomycetota bacterium]